MERDRRRFIRAIAAAGSAGFLAGCNSGGDGTATPTSEETATPTEASTQTDTPTPEPGTATPGAGTPTATATPESQGRFGSDTLIIQKAGGSDIWETVDRGHFFYKWSSGDFDVRVRVLSVENTDSDAKGGIMARASLDADAAHVYVRRRPPGYITVQWRPSKGAAARSLTSDAGADENEFEGEISADWEWMRLTRNGSTFKAYIGPDGKEWNLIAELTEENVSMPEQYFLGLAATSHNKSAITTVRYRNLQGVKPDRKTNLDSPIKKGSVTVAEPALASPSGASDVATDAATLTGELESMGGADQVDLTFQYREIMQAQWQQAGQTTVSSTGSISASVSGLTPRRYYQYRIVADDGEVEYASPVTTFATPGPSSRDSEGPRSAAPHDPADGFAKMAPWLDDSTPIIKITEPSLKQVKRAFNVNGPRVIVFETSGTIDLGATTLSIPFGQCWVAGQTAPSPGITFNRGGIALAADDIVLQHVRVRAGDAGQSKGSGFEPNAIETADDTKNNVIDHCSASWGVDEVLSVGYRNGNTTVSNCLVAEPLVNSIHHEGAHGYSTLIGDNSQRVALMGQVWAFTTDRNPRLKQGCQTATVNNLAYSFRDGAWADPETRHDIVGNVYDHPKSDQANIFGEGEAYIEDNLTLNGDVPMVGSNITQLDSRPFWPEGMEAISSDGVKETNLTHAGARPADRSRVDKRIVTNIREGKSYTIDSQSEVGGYPALFANKVSHDIPETGLRAWLREQARAVEPGN